MKPHLVQTKPFIVRTDDDKTINEHFGFASTNNSQINRAHMIAPADWSEPFKTPEFDEHSFIISDKMQFLISKLNLIFLSYE